MMVSPLGADLRTRPRRRIPGRERMSRCDSRNHHRTEQHEDYDQGDPSFSAALKRQLDASGLRNTYVREDGRAVASLPADSLADTGEHRLRNNYAMQVHMGRLYALAGKYLAAATAAIWSIEDDVGVPSHALDHLWIELFRREAGAVIREWCAARQLLAMHVAGSRGESVWAIASRPVTPG